MPGIMPRRPKEQPLKSRSALDLRPAGHFGADLRDRNAQTPAVPSARPTNASGPTNTQTCHPVSSRPATKTDTNLSSWPGAKATQAATTGGTSRRSPSPTLSTPAIMRQTQTGCFVLNCTPRSVKPIDYDFPADGRSIPWGLNFCDWRRRTTPPMARMKRHKTGKSRPGQPNTSKSRP